MKIKIILLLLSVSLASCTTTKLIYVSPEPYAFQYTTPTPEQAIRVKTEDAALYRAYIDKFREKLKFHNEQVRDYYKSFKSE